MRPEVRSFLDKISQEEDINRIRLAGLFAGLSSQQAVLDLISRPAERTLRWADYRPIFLTTERIEAGRKFLEEHNSLLLQVEERHGVSPEYIVAIIGVETFYGRITGTFTVLEALATLAFDYPPRASFFRQELAEYLVLSEKEGWDTVDVKGSYAGAMGMPQFIASSYRQYAVDFDDDGQRDLFGSMADILGSVGNYLARHGWTAGATPAEQWQPAEGIEPPMRALVRESLRPEIDAEKILSLGFESDALQQAIENDDRVSVMTFDNDDAEELWIGYGNFYAITRYNHSRLYALAVFQLAQAISEAS